MPTSRQPTPQLPCHIAYPPEFELGFLQARQFPAFPFLTRRLVRLGRLSIFYFPYRAWLLLTGSPLSALCFPQIRFCFDIPLHFKLLFFSISAHHLSASLPREFLDFHPIVTRGGGRGGGRDGRRLDNGGGTTRNYQTCTISLTCSH